MPALDHQTMLTPYPESSVSEVTRLRSSASAWERQRLIVNPGADGQADLSEPERDGHAWKVGESGLVEAEDFATPGTRGRGDDQVVGAAWPAGLPGVGEECSVSIRHDEVIGLDRHVLQDRFDEGLTLLTPWTFSHLHPDLQFGRGDRDDGDVVTVLDRLGQSRTSALGLD